MFRCIKQANKKARTSIALLPQDLGLVEELVTIPELDVIGCDLFWQLLDEDVTKVAEWGQTLVDMTKQAGKRSQLWLQNFNLDAANEMLLETAFNGLVSAEPDEIACYYYWRNNVNAEQVWQTTRGLLRKYPRRQLYWRQSTHPRLPVPPLKEAVSKTPITEELPIPDELSLQEKNDAGD